MKEKEKDLKAEVQQLLEQAEAADREQEATYGQDQRGDELPAELERRETRIQKIREAQRALEARAREKAAAEGGDPKQAPPKPKDPYNFTDPESRIMKGADGFVQAYNGQAAVEPDLQLIVGQSLMILPLRGDVSMGTRPARRLWNPCWARSSRRADSGGFCCVGSTRCGGNGLWCASRTTF